MRLGRWNPRELLADIPTPHVRTNGRKAARPGARGEQEEKPQGREWLKETTGFEEAKTVQVVRNGVGGPKRVWNPATRCTGDTRREPCEDRAPGSGFLELRASKGQRTSREQVSKRIIGDRSPAAAGRYGWTDEVLEGACKARSGTPTGRSDPPVRCPPKDVKVQVERPKGEDGAVKPNERLRRAGKR